MKRIIFFLMTMFLAGFAFAQETDDLEDSLFGGDDDVLIDQEKATGEELSKTELKGDLDSASLVLETKKVRFGGGLNSGLDLNLSWTDPYSEKDDYWKSFKDPNSKGLYTDLGAHLFFDARPNDNVKLYSKFLFNYPFEKSISGLVVDKSGKPLSYGTSNLYTISSGVPYFKVQEMYTDFSAKDIAFFRFGKHAVKWGTGYFYSPADVLNISRIDPQDPTADKEGAISLRSHIIIPKTQHNIWLYLLPPTQKDNNFDPKYTATAAMGEMIFGDWEVGLGGFYKYEKAPRFITTLSGSIAGEVSVFAEGVFAWGSDYTYYKNDGAYTEYELKDDPFFQATLGGSYSNSDSHTSVALQYYYNGFGYKNIDEMPELVYKNQKQMGQHYIAFTVSQNELGTDKLSLSLFQQFAVTELTGMSALTLRWDIYKFASLSTGPTFVYPLSSKAYTKGSISYQLSFSLGGGRF